MYTWNIDGMHSEIGFKIKHMMVSTVKGNFKTFEGTIVAPNDSYENATIKFSADAGSINTNNEHRDGHLKSEDFFDVEKFPKLTFVSTKITKTGENEYEITGDFTMHGVTKEVTLKAVFNGISKNGDGDRVSGFDITGSISRKDFGLTWNAAVETGGVVVSDEVVFDMSIELKESK